MKSEQVRPIVKINYEKPTAVDLGPAAQIVGASCVYGDEVNEGYCAEAGNGASGACAFGNAAGGQCDSGDSAGFRCIDGFDGATF